MRFIDIDNSIQRPKATIHLTGKLGFNQEAAKMMELGESSYYQIAVDDEGGKVSALYLVTSEAEVKNAVKVAKAGQYYYVSLGPVFKKLKLDYERYIIVFDVEEGEYDGKEMFILRRRAKKEKLRPTSDTSSDEE